MVKLCGMTCDNVTKLRAKKRVKVLGPRNVWSTLCATISLAVRNVFSNTAKIPSEQLAIKQKYMKIPVSKRSQSGGVHLGVRRNC